MASLAALIATKLDADIPAIVFADTGRNTFTGFLPNKPDTAIRILTSPSSAFDRVMKGGGTGIAVENHSLQVLLRAADFEAGDALMKLIFTSLDNFVGTIGGVRFLHIMANHPPGPLGQDESTRYMWSVNFRVRKEVG